MSRRFLSLVRLFAAWIGLTLSVFAPLRVAGWKAKSTQDFLEERVPAFFSTEQYPANSPDFNGVENKLSQLKEEIRKRKPKTKAELQAVIQEIWRQITTKENVRNIYDSFPERMRDCIKKKGGMTRF